MATRPGQKIKMTSIDELLCVPETEGTTELDIRAIYRSFLLDYLAVL